MSDGGRPPAVLIVEDDPDSSRALEWVLELGGYAPVSVENGRKALQYLREGHETRLVILDLQLPDIPGDALYALVRAEPGLQGLPVIVHTGRNHIPSMPGVFATVLKGVAPNTLLRIVDEAAGRKSVDALSAARTR
jgi:CheY-like chemotaxis protein